MLGTKAYLWRLFLQDAGCAGSPNLYKGFPPSFGRAAMMERAVVPRQQDVWYRAPFFSPLKSFLDCESGIEQWLIRRYITIHSFILGHSCSRKVAWDICRRRDSTIRAIGQTNPIHPGPIRTDLIE